MNLYTGVFVIVAAALAQVAIAPAFSIFGALPNLVLIVLVAWIVVRGKNEALPLIFVGGIALGLFDTQDLGVALLALAPLILMADIAEMRLVNSELGQAMLIITAATILYEVAFLLTLTVKGAQIEWLAAVRDVLVPAIIANAVVLLPVYGLLRLASVEHRRPAY